MRKQYRIWTAAALLWIAASLVLAGPAVSEDKREGPPVVHELRTLRLDSVVIEGNARTRSDIILSYLGLKPGDPVDVDVFEAARHRLIDTDYFRDVNFSTRPGAERGTVVLVIEVEERRASFETGFGYDDLDGWFLTLLGLRVDNAFHTESRFRMGMRWGFRVTGADMEWDQSLRPGGSYGLNLRAYMFQRHQVFFGAGPATAWAGPGWNQYDQSVANVGVEASLRRDIGASARLWLGAKTRYAKPDSIFQAFDSDNDLGADELPPQLQADLGGNVLTGPFLRGVRDTRDSENYPTRGSFSILKTEATYSQISEKVYTKTTVDLRKHFGLGKHHVFSARASGGYISDGAPYYERFYLGGNYSIRGFENWSLSATDGDDAYWLVNAELRVPLTAVRGEQPRLTGLLFLDAGQGWSRATDGVDDVRVGVGYGVRMRLPWIGTFGLDAGVPLTDSLTGTPFVVHGIMGFSF